MYKKLCYTSMTDYSITDICTSIVLLEMKVLLPTLLW